MQARFLLFGVLCLIGLALAPSVQACQGCGNKGGVPFARIHPGRDAAQIIIFVRADSELRSFSKRADLSFRLERSGHTVHLVDNEQDLYGAIRANRTDLVLAEPADATALRARLMGDSAAPLVLSFIPTTGESDPDPAAANCLLRATVDQSNYVVQTIESFIGTRQTTRCESTGGQN